MKQVLRPYQVTALDELRDGFRRGLKRQVLVAPTGSGKTTIAAEMIDGAVTRNRRVLFVAHRKELIDQASARLDEHGIHDHGIIMADHPRRRPQAPVQVASIQTLIRRDLPPADLVIIDEAHHSAADSYGTLFSHYENAWFVGPTATPWRKDGRGLKELFDGLVVAATPRQLIDEGHLCDYAGFKYVAPSLDGIKTVAGDYEQRGLSLVCSESAIIGNVVDEWLKHASSLRTILFAVNIAHSEKLCAAFAAQGVRVETIDCYMAKADREAVIARVRSGETQIIANVGILGEGVDIPALECAVLARPTKSLSLYLQQVGRIMRPYPGKLRARIHDHGGLVDRFGLPDAPRDYSLEATRKSNPSESDSLSSCPACFAIFERDGDTCPECGYMLRVEKKPSSPVQGVAVDIRGGAIMGQINEMNAFKEGLVRTAIERGYAPGYVVHQWKKRYPNAPLPWGAFRRVKAAQGG